MDGVIVWTVRQEQADGGNGWTYFVEQDSTPASFSAVITAWVEDAAFRTLFNGWLADSLYAAFKWETPCVTVAGWERPFECTLLNAPWLETPPDPSPFAAHFRRQRETAVFTFPNLGGDALMVVPRRQGDAAAYGHLGAFVRRAPAAQQDALWQAVGEAMQRRIGDKPVWLSTAGGGVSWLHVRLDDRPKYYGHAPYRNCA